MGRKCAREAGCREKVPDYSDKVASSLGNPMSFPKVIFLSLKRTNVSARSDERPSAHEIAHTILDLYLKRFESPAERLWQRYVI